MVKKFLIDIGRVVKVKTKNLFLLFVNNLFLYIHIMQFLLPYLYIYLVYKIGVNVWILFLPILLSICFSIILGYLDLHNKGRDIPKPTHRFTTDMGDGEITIKQEELPEIILYLYDVENWLDRNSY